jgi:hypothetical protein
LKFEDNENACAKALNSLRLRCAQMSQERKTTGEVPAKQNFRFGAVQR